MATMSKLSATWTRLQLSSLPRSSHTLSVHKPSTAVLFSGELQPREPVSNEVFLVDVAELTSSASKALENVASNDTTPGPRVGSAAASVGDKTYLFSGRAGKDFSTTETTLYEFSSATKRWRAIAPETDSILPKARSYHAMTATNSAVYVHAGCGASGDRLNDLWKYEIQSATWTKLADGPGSTRGGTSIVASSNGTRLYRIGGFDGKKEIGGSVDVYDVAQDSWSSNLFDRGPAARSVAGFVSRTIAGKEHLIYLFGETDPSNQGHAGAGKFLGDVWAYDIDNKQWSEIEGRGERPDPRGWFSAVAIEERKILLQGGLGAENNRLGDWWILQLDN